MPSPPPTTTQAFSINAQEGTPTPQTSPLSIRLKPASVDWSFLDQDTLGTGSQWSFPSGSFVMYQKGYIVDYTIKFHTDCLKNSVILRWAATGDSFVSLNGQFIRIWASPYPSSIHTLSISTSQLLCGCNTIKIQVYNYRGESPAALVHQLSQTRVNCYLCSNTGVNFYNRNTCKCECSSICECKRNMSWANYPQCGCVCSRSLKCTPGKYFHRQKCTCDCLPRCCKKGYFQSTVSCNCIKFPVLASNNFITSSISVNPWLFTVIIILCICKKVDILVKSSER